MPELNPIGYSKILYSGDFEKLPLISEQFDVIDDVGVPVPIRLALHQRQELLPDMDTPDGAIIIYSIKYEEEDLAAEIFECALKKPLQGKELYDFVEDQYQGMYEEIVIGRIAFNILPGPISVHCSTDIPRICGAYIEEPFRQLRVTPRGYVMLGNCYGVVQSDQEQTVYGARLWLSSLPRFGTVKVVDSNAKTVLEEIFHSYVPKGEHWDGTILVGTEREEELKKMGMVPISKTSSKKHIILEFVPSN